MSFETAEQSALANPNTLLAEFASATGGILLSDSNDSRKMASQIAEDIGSYWEIAFSPEVPALDGSFHPIAVKVKRKDVKIQALKGFYALGAGDFKVVAPYEVSLLQALNRNPPPEAIPFEALTLDLNADPTGNIVTDIVAELPIAEFDLEDLPAENTFRLKAAVLASLRDKSCNITERLSQQIDYAAPLASKDKALRGTLHWHCSLNAKHGDYTLEVSFSDRTTKRYDVKKIPVTIPARNPNALEIGAISRVRADASMSPHAINTLPLAGANDSISLNIPLQPTPNQPLPPTLQAEIYKDNELAANLAVPNTFISIPTQTLELGDYSIQFKATQGTLTATRSYDFHLTASPSYQPKPKQPDLPIETTVSLTLPTFTAASTTTLTKQEQSALIDELK